MLRSADNRTYTFSWSFGVGGWLFSLQVRGGFLKVDHGACAFRDKHKRTNKIFIFILKKQEGRSAESNAPRPLAKNLLIHNSVMALSGLTTGNSRRGVTFGLLLTILRACPRCVGALYVYVGTAQSPSLSM